MARDSRQMAGKSSMAPGGELPASARLPSAQPGSPPPPLAPLSRPGPRSGPVPWPPPQPERLRAASPSGPSRLQDGGRPPLGGGKARLPHQRWRRNPLRPPFPPTRPARRPQRFGFRGRACAGGRSSSLSLVRPRGVVGDRRAPGGGGAEEREPRW